MSRGPATPISARNDPGNPILRRLPAHEAALVAPFLEEIRLVAGHVLCEAGAPIEQVVFPMSGVVSLLACNAEGAVLEVGIVGRDGMFGTALTVDLTISRLRATVRCDGHALRIDAARYRAIVVDCPKLRGRANRYAHRLTDQIAQTAICNAFHSIEARSARWMLSTSDRVQSDAFAMTQSLLAAMLGVLRPTVSHAASALARDGLVTYSRGRVRIVDRAGLEAAACSCYPTAAEQYRAAIA